MEATLQSGIPQIRAAGYLTAQLPRIKNPQTAAFSSSPAFPLFDKIMPCIARSYTEQR